MRVSHGERLTVLLVALASLALLLFPLAQSQASPPPPTDRFRWIDAVEDFAPRDVPDRLSRPAPPSRQPADVPPTPGLTGDFTRYPTSAQLVTSLFHLEVAYPHLVETYDIGRSWQERPIMAVRIGNEATGDPDARPAFYLDGQHHAREAISAQVVLYFVTYLASEYGHDPLVTHLVDTRTVYAIPSVNPDGNDIFLDADQRQRKTANPTASDDDSDGLFDEDPREGAGYGTYEVYHYEFDPEWADTHPVDPFAPGWEGHLLGRTYRGIFDGAGIEIPQQDNDADGEVNEDPPGGVDPNRNYDSHWDLGDDDPTTEIYSGPRAFSEPETRAVRDFVLARLNITTASSVHSGVDLLLHPWGWSAEGELLDRLWYELLSRKGSQLTEVNGFRGAPHTWTARGLYAASGSTIDWLYERGVLAWTPEVYGASALAFAQRITATNTYTVGLSIGEGFNPPPEDILRVADRWNRWHLYLLAATPNVGLSEVAVGDGGLTVTIGNDGLLPLDVAVSVETGQGISSTSLAGLSSAERTWLIPLQPGPLTQTATITMLATSQIGIASGPRQVESVTLEMEIGAGTVRVLEGRMEPFSNLGDAFGGWFAGREWDTDDYHLGPGLLLEGFVPIVERGD